MMETREVREVPLRDETNGALAVVRSALGLLRESPGAHHVRNKVGRDIVTGTDLAVEDHIRRELLARFPVYPVVGEERGGETSSNGPGYWLVDPLCGTRNFASGMQVYCVNVALVEGGQVTAAVVGDGTTGEIYVAEHGMGAHLITAAGTADLRASGESLTIAVDEAAAAENVRPQAADFVRGLLLRDRWHIRMFGSTLTIVKVASGALAASVIVAPPSPVHVAAGALIAMEAGAFVTDISGQPWDVRASSFMAVGTAELHQELLAVLRGASSATAC